VKKKTWNWWLWRQTFVHGFHNLVNGMTDAAAQHELLKKLDEQHFKNNPA
jgi:hypothetical protein